MYCYLVNDITQNRPRFIQIPSKRLKKDTRTQENKSTFIFIADKVFGFPVVPPTSYKLFKHYLILLSSISFSVILSEHYLFCINILCGKSLTF